MPTRNTVVVLTASPFIPSSSSLCSSYLLSVPSFIAPAEDSERRRRRRQSPSSPRIISIFYDVHCGNCSTMLLRPVEHEALKSCVYLRCIPCTRSAQLCPPSMVHLLKLCPDDDDRGPAAAEYLPWFPPIFRNRSRGAHTNGMAN